MSSTPSRIRLPFQHPISMTVAIMMLLAVGSVPFGNELSDTATISSIRNTGMNRTGMRLPLQATCLTTLQSCRRDPSCRGFLEQMLHYCDPMRCRQETCMKALQKFYREVESTFALDVAFCMCRKTDNPHDPCKLAREQLHPVCAQGVNPSSCHSLVESCRAETECRFRLEHYEEACAVDGVRKCAGLLDECRNAMIRILGTKLRTSCACGETHFTELYDCLGWQRILWVNPCVVESQRDYHRLRVTTTTLVPPPSNNDMNITTILGSSETEENPTTIPTTSTNTRRTELTTVLQQARYHRQEMNHPYLEAPVADHSTTIPSPDSTTTGVLNCIQAQDSCKNNTGCKFILKMAPIICGNETRACSTVTIIKCQALLRALQALPYFTPKCSCEPNSPAGCRTFHNFLYDNPCSVIHELDNTGSYPVDVLPTCDYALDVCKRQPECIQDFRAFRSQCSQNEDKQCRMKNVELCRGAWNKFRLTHMVGCVCPGASTNSRCTRIFQEVNNHPCVIELGRGTASTYSPPSTTEDSLDFGFSEAMNSYITEDNFATIDYFRTTTELINLENPRYCRLHQVNSEDIVEKIREGSSKRLYYDNSFNCSELCVCETRRRFPTCIILGCLDIKDCILEGKNFSHLHSRDDPNRGQCLCHAGQWICEKPLSTWIPQPGGVFLFLGFSRKDEHKLWEITRLRVENVVDALNQLVGLEMRNFFDENDSEDRAELDKLEAFNGTRCSLSLIVVEEYNLIINVTVEDQGFPGMRPRNNSECLPLLQVIVDLINNQHPVVRGHNLLSILKLAGVQDNTPEVRGVSVFMQDGWSAFEKMIVNLIGYFV